MMSARIERLAALQRPCGGFESVVATRTSRDLDVNGFTTAWVLTVLDPVVADPALASVKSRALDFLEGCAWSSPKGAYGFWPERSRPAWAAKLPPDVDDSALMLAQLHRNGRMSREAALHALCTAILPCRVPPGECIARPPWVVPGCFETWIVPRGGVRPRVQVVDACVNANVAALMAQLGAPHLPGFREACTAIDRGLAWAGDERARLASLTPFYPSRRGFAEALERAVERGASALAPAARRVAALAFESDDDAAACCCSAYGHAVWRCPALEEARAIARSAAG
ncbi:MAG TPA: hypothetical protein VLS49_01160 [Usitatibacter sp.]|nr:hypothetical protein [Usitatibacter sp.]